MADPLDTNPAEETFDDVVFVDGVAMSPDAAAIRQQAGTGTVESEASNIRAASGALAEENLGTLGQVQAGVEGAAEGLTLGLSRQFTDDDQDTAYEAERRRREFSGTFAAGEVGGAVLGALASGGGGAAGTFARMTPAGITAAKAARFIGRGTSAAGKLGRSILAGAGEGAVQAAAQAIGRNTVASDPLSAEAVALDVFRGGALGGAVGGVFGGAGLGLSKLRERLAGSVDDTARKMAGVGGAADDIPTNRILDSSDEVVEEAERKLWARLDDVKSRNLGTELDEIANNPVFLRTGVGKPGIKALGKARSLGDELEETRKLVADWSDRYKTALDEAPGSSKAAKATAIAEDLDDEGSVLLAHLDDVEQKFDGQLKAIRERYIAPPPEAAAPAIPAQVPQGPTSLLGRARQLGETAAGGLETAQDLGAPVPTVSQLLGGGPVGTAVGWYLRLKAGARVLRGKGGKVPRTPETTAAESVVTLRRALKRALDAPVSVPKPKSLPVAVIQKSARALREVADAKVDGLAAAGRLGFNTALAQQSSAASDRATEYLSSTAPKNPFQGSAFADNWNVNPVEARTWQRQVNAVMDPLSAIERIMTDPMAIPEVEAIMHVYPGMANEIRSYLLVNADRLVSTLSTSHRHMLGRAFNVPLTITQMPGYGASLAGAAAKQVAPQTQKTASPRGSTTSPLASLAQVKEPHE